MIAAEADPEAKQYLLRCRRELIRRMVELAVAHRRRQRIQELETEVETLRHLVRDGMH